MAKKKRHSRAEIATKLVQASEMARQGKLQSEIASALGISVMTLHRWRKAPPGSHPVREAVKHRYPMRDLAQVRCSLALAARDRRCGEISELCYRQLQAKFKARLAELLEAGVAGRYRR